MSHFPARAVCHRIAIVPAIGELSPISECRRELTVIGHAVVGTTAGFAGQERLDDAARIRLVLEAFEYRSRVGRLRRCLHRRATTPLALTSETRAEIRRAAIAAVRSRRVASGAAGAFEHLFAELLAGLARRGSLRGVAVQRVAAVDEVPTLALHAIEASGTRLAAARRALERRLPAICATHVGDGSAAVRPSRRGHRSGLGCRAR